MSSVNERVTTVAMDVIAAITERMIAHGVTYEEYHRGLDWLVDLAASGELELFCDLHFDAPVERAATAGRPGSEGAVLGPFHQPDHPVLTPPYRLPKRAGEGGTPFIFSAGVNDLAGRPLAGVSVDVWQCAADGLYSGFGRSDAPAGNLRGLMQTDDAGNVRFATIEPVPYPVPNEGLTGQFLRMTGRRDWRPAHFHFILEKKGFETLVTQIFFAGDRILEGEGDVLNGVKDSLVIKLGEGRDAELASTYEVSTPYATGEYSFVLRPAA